MTARPPVLRHVLAAGVLASSVLLAAPAEAAAPAPAPGVLRQLVAAVLDTVATLAVPVTPSAGGAADTADDGLVGEVEKVLLGSDDPAAPAGDRGLVGAAEDVLAQATAGLPLTVVVTRRTDDAPDISTTTAASEGDALRLITRALADPATVGVDMAQRVTTAASNDTFRSRQWALNRFGAEAIWKKTTGKGVVVAVIDTGVHGNHSDIKGRVLAGRDFVAPGTSANDENGHGTHIAGAIAATANNRRGIAGLAPGATILPVRVLDADGVGDSGTVAKGIVWAVQKGAKVLNLSLTSTRPDTAERAAIEYALSKNVVVVAAAGNSGCGFLFGSGPAYPAAYDGVLGVGAIGSGGSVASYSNCGSYVDVVAPGSDIFSLTISQPRGGCPARTGYCALSGTSMATSYASAAAALAISRAGRGWTQAAVRSLLESTATDIGQRGRDSASGAGVINPSRVVR